MNRILSVVRSMTDKIIELSRGVVTALAYGEINRWKRSRSGQRIEGHGLPRTVTFLTGTSGRDFFDRSNVGTHAHFTPGGWVP